MFLISVCYSEECLLSAQQMCFWIMSACLEYSGSDCLHAWPKLWPEAPMFCFIYSYTSKELAHCVCQCSLDFCMSASALANVLSLTFYCHCKMIILTKKFFIGKIVFILPWLYDFLMTVTEMGTVIAWFRLEITTVRLLQHS